MSTTDHVCHSIAKPATKSVATKVAAKAEAAKAIPLDDDIEEFNS